MKKMSTKTLRNKKNAGNISMLTCYDYQTATLLNETDLDCILVGDSLGNVILGFDSTIPVKVEHMILFGQAVRRGASKKFLILDLPFGSYQTVDQGIANATQVFQETGADAVKLEGANKTELAIISRLSEIGIPVVGHIGLQPQSYKTQGGYFIQGKDESASNRLLKEAEDLQDSGCFMIVLECVAEGVAQKITQKIHIPTIGIGSGNALDGQVLVINDLLKDCQNQPPSFCQPITDIYDLKKKSINSYLEKFQSALQ